MTPSGGRPSSAIGFSGKSSFSLWRVKTIQNSIEGTYKLLFQASARAGPAKSNYGARDLGLSPLLPARHQRRPACPSCRQGWCGRPTLWAGAWSAVWDLAYCLCQVLSWTHSLEDLSGSVIGFTRISLRCGVTLRKNAENNILSRRCVWTGGTGQGWSRNGTGTDQGFLRIIIPGLQS